jgi:putative membrane protein
VATEQPRAQEASEPTPAARRELDPDTYMATQRTALSLERTSMSADNTQMSVLRTSLSLIGFGFTIYKFFDEVSKDTLHSGSLDTPARRFGITLVLLGVGLLIASLFNHYRTMKSLRARRATMFEMGLLQHPPTYSTSANMVVSILLLIGGLLVVVGIILRTGPFG